jgi:hypothetical protein
VKKTFRLSVLLGGVAMFGLLAPVAAIAAEITPMGHTAWGTLCAGGCGNKYADAYGWAGVNPQRSGFYNDSYYQDDKADGNSAYVGTDFQAWLPSENRWDDDSYQETKRITPGDGRREQVQSTGLDGRTDKMRAATGVCVDLALRPDICSNNAFIEETY